MNILITGGAGYIGSFVLRAFLEQKKHDICVVDNLSSGSLKTLEILKNLGDFAFCCFYRSSPKYDRAVKILHK